MKDRVNQPAKDRESLRPFTPPLRGDAAPEYFARTRSLQFVLYFGPRCFHAAGFARYPL
jgi:predicted NodU family carbamoyl transferase